MEKRIKKYNINKKNIKQDRIQLDIDFELSHLKRFEVLGRTFTIKNINMIYDSHDKDKVKFTINTLKGPSLEGFNLKQKHLKEIKEIVKDILGVELKEGEGE